MNATGNFLAWLRKHPRTAAVFVLVLSALLLCAEYFLTAHLFTPGLSRVPGRAVALAIALAALATAFTAAVSFVALLAPAPLARVLFSRRRIDLRLWIFLGLVGFSVFVWSEENWRARRDWDQFRHQLEVEGETIRPESILPSRMPDEENLACAPIVKGIYATHLDAAGNWINQWNTNVVNRLAMSVIREGDSIEARKRDDWRLGEKIDLKVWQDYYRAASNSETNAFPVAALPQTPAADVLLALSRFDSVLDELRLETKQRPQCRFPLDYENKFPPDILLPHLAAIKSCLEVLRLRACAHLRQNENQKALDEVLLMLRLIDSIRGEPILISQLVRVAGWNLTAQPIWEGTVDHRWSEIQLKELEEELAKFDFLSAYQLAMRGERWMWVATVDYFEDTRQPYRLKGTDEIRPDQWPQVFLFKLLPESFFDRNKLQIARLMHECELQLVSEPRHEISPRGFNYFMNIQAKELKRRTPANYYATKILPPLGGAVKRFASAQASLNLARVACALELYRLAHGSYPDTFEAAASRLPEEFSEDVIDGKSLGYRQAANDRYVLYSIGWNMKDDGGVTATKSGTTPAVDLDQGDWVWQFPPE